ncbi:conserved hypothetical protein [Ricinus communis]|uniref:Rhamnogalacturonase A/B/Epimerase-like pectate lyase domain-containing protein n=1 Tax=Ricinus communis TaxID=3988 RepID=B9SSW9_RICCO|nr:conserved hypothetical protein [Ricinus communis]
MSNPFILVFYFIFITSPLVTSAQFNVLSYGANPDGRTDCTKAFLTAWTQACASTRPAIISVPPGRFLVSKLLFQGPCKNNAVLLSVDGSTLVAPSDYWATGNAQNWLIFEYVDGVTISGGILDGQGMSLWSCKASGKKCPTGATSLGFSNSNNIAIIGIGSLGKDLQEAGVQNVTVKTAKFTGTQNGLRIKSWGRPSNGFARNILFQHATMIDVKNPIVIDQNYCPHNKNCPGQVSGVQISGVTYQDIHGTSATEVAVRFDCSKKTPCTGIKMEDIRLTYRNQPADASCNNADGRTSGFVQPSSCLS